MADLLHWLTLYAPVVFAIQMWFGPGWCCPPLCPPPPDIFECEDTTCINGEMGATYSVEITGVENGACSGTPFDGIYILTAGSAFPFPCQAADNGSVSGLGWLVRTSLGFCVNGNSYTNILRLRVFGNVEFSFTVFSVSDTNSYTWRHTPPSYPIDCVGMTGLSLAPHATTPSTAAYSIANTTCIVDSLA